MIMKTGKIKVNGKIYDTFKDEYKVLRFKPNNLINKLHYRFDIKTSEVVKLYQLGAITLMDLLDYYAGIGFTVCGVQELSFFEEFSFEIIK